MTSTTHKILFALGLSLILLSVVATSFVFARDPESTWNGPVFYGCPNNATDRAANKVILDAYNQRNRPAATVCTSAPNACGATTVTRQACSFGEGNGRSQTMQWTCSSCSAVAPPSNPAGYGSACTVTNSCGSSTKVGTIQCDGSCSAAQPSEALCSSSTRTTIQTTTQVTPVNSGETTFTTPYSAFSVLKPFNIQITAGPSLVALGGTSVIAWNQEVNLARIQSCVVNSTNSESWSGNQGSQDVSIDDETTFTLQCTSTDGVVATDSVKVRLVPNWQEF